MKIFVKRLLKILLGVVLLGLVAFLTLYLLYNKPLPQGKAGQEADVLAKKMLRAINYDQYRKTDYLEWTFAKGTHRFQWDKKRGKVQVSWDDYVAHLNLNSVQGSTVYEDGIEVLGGQKTSAIEKALNYFNNDSFWLVAPFKVFDQGTTRSTVKLDDGSEGLLVTYTSGGSTPGDSYLWKLRDNGFPESYQMWVKIIPVGGLKATWDDWKVMQNGLFLPASHKIGPMTLDMGEPKAYD